MCVAYEVDGKRVNEFPVGDALLKAKPIYDYLDGWKCDITSCRKFVDLPKEAQEYIKFIENATDCKIKYISVGADREQYIEK